MKYEKERENLANKLLKNNIISSNDVYNAIKKVPRHLFIPKRLWKYAYADRPQLIGEGQTISAPHMNTMMCEYLKIKRKQKILEIGTGSGYHAALLAQLVGENGQIFTVERHQSLVKKAKQKFKELNLNNISVFHGDGIVGLKKYAPYDRILVTAAGPKIPQDLKEQLSDQNGIMCIPVGNKYGNQDLIIIKRHESKFSKKIVCKVIFVPLIGKDGF